MAVITPHDFDEWQGRIADALRAFLAARDARRPAAEIALLRERIRALEHEGQERGLLPAADRPGQRRQRLRRLLARDRGGVGRRRAARDPDVGDMIAPPAGARILLATKPVGFCKGAHSLAALAAEVLGANPFSGAVLVFHSRRADRIKIVLWDGSGLVGRMDWSGHLPHRLIVKAEVKGADS